MLGNYNKDNLSGNIMQIGGSDDYTNPDIGEPMFPNVLNTKYVINIDKIYFMLIYKTTTSSGRELILLKSSRENAFDDKSKYKLLVFYRSLSELGFLRLGGKIGHMYGHVYMKGTIHYIQQTFIDARLQKFINKNVSKLKSEPGLDIPFIQHTSNLYAHIEDPDRAIKIPGFFQYKSYCGDRIYELEIVKRTIHETSELIKNKYTYSNNQFLYKYQKLPTSKLNINYSYNMNSVDLIPNDSNEQTLVLLYIIIDFCSHGDKMFTSSHTPEIGKFQDMFGVSGEHCKYSDFFFPVNISRKLDGITEYGTYEKYVLSSNFVCKFLEYTDACTSLENNLGNCDKSGQNHYSIIADRFVDIHPFNEIANTHLITSITNGTDITDILSEDTSGDIQNKINSNTGLSPLMYSIIHNNYDAFEKLLQKGVNVNYTNVYTEESALMYIKNDTDIKFLQLLIDNGIDLDYFNKIKQYDVPTYFITHKPNAESIGLLLENGVVFDKGNIESLLSIAIETNVSLPVIELLAKNTTNINKVYGSYNPYSALTTAIDEERLKVIQLLIQYGSDLTLVVGGRTALMCAISTENLEIVNFLVSQSTDNINYAGKKESALTMAIRLNNFSIVKILVDNGVDVNVAIGDISPLMGITVNTSLKIPELLLQSGSDVNYVSSTHSVLSLLVAVYINSYNKGTTSQYDNEPNLSETRGLNTLKLLVKYGADVNISVQGISALKLLYDQRTSTNPSIIMMTQFLVNHDAKLTADDIKNSRHNSINELYNTVSNFPFMNNRILISILLNEMQYYQKTIESKHKEILSWLIYYNIPIKSLTLLNIKEPLNLFPRSLESIAIEEKDRHFIKLYKYNIKIQFTRNVGW